MNLRATLLVFSIVTALVGGANGQVFQFAEDFRTTQYKDGANTTAWWDTVGGEIKLFPFQITQRGLYNTPGGGLNVALVGAYAYIADGNAVIQYAKQIAGMDIEDRRRPQQGSLSVDVANKPVDIVLSTAGSTTGQRMQLRVVQEAIRQELGGLGLTDEMLASIRKLATGTGIILVSGPPHNGVTSTLYSPT